MRTIRVLVRCLIVVATLFGFSAAGTARAAAASCYYATSGAAHALCFLDLTAYSGAGAYNFSYVLADGSTFTGTLTNTGTAATPKSIPTVSLVALGTGAYLGVLGKPALYSANQGSGVGPYVLSNLALTDTQGRVSSTVAVVGADAESTTNQDTAGSTTALVWNTTGSNLTLLQTVAPVQAGGSSCTLTGVGTATAHCAPNGGDPGDSNLLGSGLASGQTFTMSAVTPARQAFAFALQTALLTVAKNVASRVNSTDQFRVRLLTAGGTEFAGSTTSGTGTTASASAGVVPGTAYTLKEAATSGSLGNYASTYTCVNAVTSSTTLPAANTSGTSLSITPALDDQITCTFTNVGLTLTNTPVNATASDAANATVTDSFTLTNTSTIAGTIAVAAPTITSSTGSTVTPSGYTYNGTTYGGIGALNTAIAAAGTTAPGGSITVGVTYTTNATTSSSTDAVALPATVSSGTGTSPASIGTETDSIAPLPTATSGTKCYVATSGKAHLICWLDFTGYAGLGSESFSLTMPDGSILTGTVNNTGSVSAIPGTSPQATKAAFGNTTYVGIQGEPIFTIGATSTYSPIVLSNLKLTDPLGFSVTTVGMVGTDAEVTNTPGFGIQEMLNWQTTGAAFTLLETQQSPNGSNVMCTLSATPSQNVTCAGVSGSQVDDYMLRTILNTTTSGAAQSYSMAGETSYNQAWAYGINLSLLTATKTISSRVAAADQFSVQVSRGVNGAATPTPAGAPLASASTSGTGTTASATTPTYVIPNDTYVFGESMAAGSPSLLSQYATTYTCTNSMPTAGVTQILPAANSSGQSVAIVPQPDANITCAFTNVAVTMTNAAVTPTATDPVATTETDKFTLTNTSSVAGTFTVAAPTITPFSGATAGTAFAPTGYTLTVGATTTTYGTLAALNAALAGMTPTAAGAAVVVGVTYATTAGTTTSDVVSLPATIASGTGTSATTTASETDTLTANAALTIAKTGTTAASPGGLIAYSILVSNPGPSAANGSTFSDPLPTGVVVTGTPVCGSATGGAVCGAVAVNSGTVTSTITTLPVNGSVTFSITASAAASASYTNTASVTPPSGTSGGTVTSSLTTVVSQASGLQKTVANVTSGTAAATADTAVPGDTLRYTLSFTNTTGSTLSKFTFTDVVPAHTTFVAAACPATGSGTTLPTGVTCTPTAPAVGTTGTTVTFPFTGTLAAGSTVTASIDVKVI